MRVGRQQLSRLEAATLDFAKLLPWACFTEHWITRVGLWRAGSLRGLNAPFRTTERTLGEQAMNDRSGSFAAGLFSTLQTSNNRQ
jgi:hypothetical protein